MADGLSQAVIDLLEEWIGADFSDGDFNGVVFTWEQPLIAVLDDAPVTLYFSSTTYKTTGVHTPAHQLFRPLLQAPDMGASVLSSSAFKRSGSVQVGSIQLSNINGELDEWLDGSYVWEGTTGKLRVGAPDWDYAAFEELIPVARVDEFRFDEKKITLTLNHGIANFDDLYQEDLFTYSDVKILDSNDDFIVDTLGDAIGANAVQVSLGESLIGQPWPDAWGHIRNAEPRLRDKDYGPGYYRYAVRRGEVDAFEVVYEGGLPLTETANYETDLEQGEFSKFTAPQATVSCQLRGAVIASSYLDRPAEISEAILEEKVGLSPSQINSVAAAAYDVEFNFASGIYIREPLSRRDVLDFMTSPRGWWAPTFDGSEITFGFVVDPDDETATVTIGDEHISKLERLKTLPPAWRIVLEYARNYQIVSDLLGAAEADVRSWIQEEWRTTVFDDATILDTYPEAREIRVPTPFYDEPIAEAQNELELFGERADLYKFTLGRLPESYYLGDIAEVSKDRFGLDDGKNFYVGEVRVKPTAHEFSLVGWRGSTIPPLPPPAGIGTMVIWLDDGNFTTSSGDMDTITNQAPEENRDSLIWTANSNMVVIPNINGTGRSAFRADDTSEYVVADVLDDRFDNAGGIYCGCVFNPRTTVSGTAIFLAGGTVLNTNDGWGFGSTNAMASAINGGAPAGISAGGLLTDLQWYVGVWVCNAVEQRIYVDAVDVTLGTPTAWDGVSAIHLDHAFPVTAGNMDQDVAAVYAFAGVPTFEQINELGQFLADNFGFTQTWSLS